MCRFDELVMCQVHRSHVNTAAGWRCATHPAGGEIRGRVCGVVAGRSLHGPMT